MSERPQNIDSMTGLRLIAALAIVLTHLWPVIFKLKSGVPLADPFHQLSFFGMSLFFVLSGFIIHYNYAGLIGTLGGLYRFAVARFSRLYPLFLAVILYDLICGNFFLYEIPPLRVPYISALPYMLSATQSWIYGFVGNHPIAFPYHYTHVAWSISTEFFLYLTYPVLCVFILRARTAHRAIYLALVVASMAAIVLAALKSSPDWLDRCGALLGVVENSNARPRTLFSDWFNYIAPYTRIFEFMTGCVLAQLYRTLAGRAVGVFEKKAAALALTLAVLNICAFVLRNMLGAPSLAAGLGMAGLLPALAILIFCCARYDLGVVRALSAASLVALGEASYSIYLLHIIVIETSAPSLLVEPTLLNILLLSGRALIILAAIVILSLGTHRYFEQPARQWLRIRLAPRLRTRPLYS